MNQHYAHESGGLVCPKCHRKQVVCVDSRSDKAGTFIRRRRKCDACAHRWTTYETCEDAGERTLNARVKTARLDRLLTELKDAIDRYDSIRTDR